jgi:hypothetical protein
MIFGTYQRPGAEFPAVGLEDVSEPATVRDYLTIPFKHIEESSHEARYRWCYLMLAPALSMKPVGLWPREFQEKLSSQLQ